MTRFTGILFIVLVYKCALGAPIARMMGCGKGKPLSPDKQSFCCEHFNLDCPSAGAVDVDSALTANLEREDDDGKPEFKVHVRTLGEECKPPLYVCGVGLECKEGLCFRIKTKAHLKRLLRRGREVEKEEREQVRDGEDVDEEDPLPARKGLILEGQSLKLSDTGSQTSPETMTEGSVAGSKANDAGTMDLEEDEVAANIWELLSKTMGIKLSRKQIHNVREVIAGTIDERAEREEQVDETEGNSSPAGSDRDEADMERMSARDQESSGSSHVNGRRANRSRNGNSLGFSDPSLKSESQLKEIGEDCGPHAGAQSQRAGMQCPAKLPKRNNKGSEELVDVESAMIRD